MKRAQSSARLFRILLNAWPPLAASGVRLTEVSEDFTYARIEWRARALNLNLHGVAFGGTLFSMTDVGIGTLVAQYLGRDYEAWTRMGTFQFLRPGLHGAYLEVTVPPELGAWIRDTVAADGYANVPYTSVIYNRDGSIVGISQQDLHVRPRGGGQRTIAPQQAEEPRGFILEHLATAVVWAAFGNDIERLTHLMSEQRRIPSPADQLRHVIAAALDETNTTVADLERLRIPASFLTPSTKD